MIMNAVHVHETSRMGPQHQVFDAADNAAQVSQALAASARTDHGAQDRPATLPRRARSPPRTTHRDMEPLWGFSDADHRDGGTCPCHGRCRDRADHRLPSSMRGEIVRSTTISTGSSCTATHGYLIQQSMEPYANRRTDRWGEPLAFRAGARRAERGAAIGSRTRRWACASRSTISCPIERGGLGVDGA